MASQENVADVGVRRGNFFHIDRRSWKALCDLGDVKMAVAYLVIAQGTWKGSRFSSWSAKFIEKHTGLHSSRAKEKISQLIEAGFLKLGEKSTKTSPQYEVLAFPEVAAALRDHAFAALSDWRKCDLERVRAAGETGLSPGKRRDDFRELALAGLIQERGNRFYPAAAAQGAAELVWLPNEIVQGTGAGEREPIRLLRARNDVWALHLFVDLYQAQNLSADGGISRAVLRGKYDRKRLGQRGRHLIWGFLRNPTSSAEAWYRDGITAAHRPRPRKEGNSPLWESINVLTSLGLLYCVSHLVENEDPDCELIHAYGTDDNAEPMEWELGRASQNAAEYMLGDLLTDIHQDEIEHMAPVFDSYPEVQLVGVYRLRYRPKTSLTADWMRRLKSDYNEWIVLYRRLSGDDEELETVAPPLSA